jgi:putative ABC transport system permease protein
LLIVAEAFTLGAIGSVLGTVVGILLALGISAIGIPMPPPRTQTSDTPRTSSSCRR